MAINISGVVTPASTARSNCISRIMYALLEYKEEINRIRIEDSKNKNISQENLSELVIHGYNETSILLSELEHIVTTERKVLNMMTHIEFKGRKQNDQENSDVVQQSE